MNVVRRLMVAFVVFAFAGGAAMAAGESGGTSLIHFRPGSERLGDVIPYFDKGVYHVFYLKGSGWGHIASEDLVHWRELPDALEAGKGPGAPDGQNCWTGSIVKEGGKYRLFYTGKNSDDPKGEQKVMRASSPDLVTWTKEPD